MLRKTLRSCFTAFLVVFSGLSLAAAPDPFDTAIEHATLRSTFALKGELFHVQGLALDRRRIWVTSVDRENHRGYIHEFDRRTGILLRRLELTDGPRYHPGGISLSGRSIWVPVAEMKPSSSATLVEVDADSFRIRRRIFVADHLGCVAASDSTLVAGNWDSQRLYIIDLTRHARMLVIPNPSRTHYQDMKFVGRQLVASGTQTPWSGSVDWIDWPSMKVERTLRAGAIEPIRPLGRGGPLTGEGMAIEGRDLFVLPEDGPSRMFDFTLEF